jgi:phosphatidylglycerophosphate synthase
VTLDGYREAVKDIDAWWTVMVIDPIAVRLLPAIATRARITPLLLTLLSGACGVASAASFATGRLILGAILFEAKFFFDCLDGKLARIRNITSVFGAFIDAAADVIVTTAIFVVLAFQVRGAGVLPTLIASGVLLEAWARQYRIAVVSGTHTRPMGADGRVGRLRTILARYRLAPLPSTVEAETVALFLLPLTMNRTAIAYGLYGASGFFFAYALLHMVAVVRSSGADR